jgi:hypothetical protein
MLNALTSAPDDGSRRNRQTTSAPRASAYRAVTAALAEHVDQSTLVVAPPSPEVGAWAGAPSALLVEGTYWLAYRLRRPIGETGRGYANVVARSDDGVHFTPVAVVSRETFGAASLERPTLALADDGRWRLYVSCATPNSFHWRVDLIEAATPEGLSTASPVPVLPGSTRWAVKDPVILRNRDGWHLWAACHPLKDPANTDRMITAYAGSHDGVTWRWRGTALRGRPNRWDARGVRISTVLPNGGAAVAFYDGRASAEQNWEERTGVAIGNAGLSGGFTAAGNAPVAQSPHAGGGLRYLSLVTLPNGFHRLYFEMTRPDSAHELRTLHVIPGT